MTIALSHGGPTIYNTGRRSQQVLVGTARGVTTIERDGDGWRVADEALTDKHIGAILIEPGSGAIFAGAYRDGSLSASFDAGATWQQRDAGLTEHDVYSLEAVEINGRTRLFCGTEPAKLFASDDLGESWRELNGTARRFDRRLLEFPGAAACRPRQAHYLRPARRPHHVHQRRGRWPPAQH